MTLPPGFVALTLAKGCVCVIPERVYVAGLRLGKALKPKSPAKIQPLVHDVSRTCSLSPAARDTPSKAATPSG